jgi:hypothetical protein
MEENAMDPEQTAPDNHNASSNHNTLSLPVDSEVLFSDAKGVYKKRIEKRKMELLRKISFINKFLDPNEQIMFITKACSPFTILEQMTMGPVLLMMVKRSLLIFTNKRLFHVPTTPEYRYRASVTQIQYQDCKQMFVKGSRLTFVYQNGKKDSFLFIPRADRAKLKHINISPPELGPPNALPQRRHLCPNCTNELNPHVYSCPSCGLKFKNKDKALKYSLLLPGGGYFYSGHWVVGFFDFLVESYLIFLNVIFLLGLLLGELTLLPPLIFLMAILALEKFITIYHTNHFIDEYLPENLKQVLAEQSVPARRRYETKQPKREKSIQEILSVR